MRRIAFARAETSRSAGHRVLNPTWLFLLPLFALAALALAASPRSEAAELPLDPCPNAEFRKGVSAHLSDCRAYEYVNPSEGTADIRLGSTQTSADGSVVCFASEGSMAGAPPNGIKITDDGYCSWRTAGGWETKWVTGPAPAEPQGGVGSWVYFLEPNAERLVFASDVGIAPDWVPSPPSALGIAVSGFMWEPGVATRWLTPTPVLEQEKVSGSRRPLAASEDLTHGIFRSELKLVPGDQNDVEDVYEWYPGGIRLVTRNEAGEAVGGTVGIEVSLQIMPSQGHVSADGSRIFFMHRGSLAGSPADVQSVFMREGEELVHVSPRRGEGPDGDVFFAGASSAGDLVYLTSTQQLTDEPKEAGRAIYSYDVSADELALVADAPGGVNFLGLSEDGSTIVYRETTSRKLFVVDDGIPTELGVLPSSDAGAGANRVATTRPDQRALRITPDGSVVVFASAAGFDGAPPNVVQIYRWKSGTGLEHISFNEAGTPPTKAASIGNYPTTTPGDREEILNNHLAKANVGRVVSEDGSRVVFETPEALVAGDVNGVTDVYEWHDGQINLISTGTSPVKALYHDSSPDGSVIFFTTFDRLIPQVDRNDRRDVYAAQPNGGFPLPQPPQPCESEACQPPSHDPPPAGQPGSATGGEGNVAEAKPVEVPALRRKQLNRLADGRRTRVVIAVGEPGKVTVALKGRISGRLVKVGGDSKDVAAPDRVAFQLRLSSLARERLREAGRLRLTLEVRHSKSDAVIKRGVLLRG